MIYDVLITELALLDMKMLYEYIACVLMEPVIAEKQYSRIENAVYSLEQMPERFKRYEKNRGFHNLRIMPVDNYIVFYDVDSGGRTVTVIRVMYGGRNTEKELDDTERHDN